MKYPSYLFGWRTLGKAFRFPRCCVFHFSRGTTALELRQKTPIKYKLFTQSILDGTGYYEWVEMWRRQKNLVATGEPGEEVWTIVQRYPNED